MAETRAPRRGVGGREPKRRRGRKKRGERVKKQGESRSAPSERGDYVSEVQGAKRRESFVKTNDKTFQGVFFYGRREPNFIRIIRFRKGELRWQFMNLELWNTNRSSERGLMITSRRSIIVSELMTNIYLLYQNVCRKYSFIGTPSI